MQNIFVTRLISRRCYAAERESASRDSLGSRRCYTHAAHEDIKRVSSCIGITGAGVQVGRVSVFDSCLESGVALILFGP